MINWFAENSFGMSPSILERRLKKSGHGGKVPGMRFGECSVSYMLSIVPRSGASLQPAMLTVRGYQMNKSRTTKINFSQELEVGDGYIIKDVKSSRITSFSCYDTTVLYMFLSTGGKTNVYHCQFGGCGSLRNPRIPMYEVELFEADGFYRINKEAAYDLILKSINIKGKEQGALHYNWTEPCFTNDEDKHVCALQAEGHIYHLRSYVCIFCFRKFNDAESLVFHVNHLHLNYKCVRTSAGLRIESIEIEDKGNRSLLYFSGKYRSRKAMFGAEALDVSVSRTGVWDVGWDLKNGSVVNSVESMDGLGYLINKNIGKSKSLSSHSVALMKKWNMLRLNRNNLSDDIRRFVIRERENPSIIDFIFALYHKSVIDPKEFVDLVYELCKVTTSAKYSKSRS